MAGYDDPFSHPETQNLFRNPQVQQAVRSQVTQQVLNDFHPFGDRSTGSQPTYGTQVGSSQQAIVEPTGGTQYNSSSWEAEDLRRKQEELDRKAAELQRREEEMEQSLQYQPRINNFPPLPGRCPLKPCFYQDFSIDIPLEFQSLVKQIYYLWIAYSVLLLVNVVGSMTYLIASSSNEISNNSGSTFGMSLVNLILNVPLSFVCWYRPAYNAFKDDSSFNFFLFFFIFFFQFCVNILQCLGIDGWGTVGIINSAGMFGTGIGGAIFAGVIMILIGFCFGAAAICDGIILMKVHRVFRSSGASFSKAQQEFSQGVINNKTVRQTANNAAASAAKTAVEQQWR